MPLPDDFGVPIRSEMIEPFGAVIIGRLFERCERVKHDPHQFMHACQSLWMAIEGLTTVAIAIGTAIHFNVAVGNHQSQIADYIRKELNVDPFREWSR